MVKFNGVHVISATMVADRLVLGEKVTQWMADHPTYEIVDIIITQSSDSAFHCICFALFYLDPVAAARTFPPVTKRIP